MDTQLLARFFMWCTILNAGLMALVFLLWLVAADLIYKAHGKWYPMPRETFNVEIYRLLGTYKVLVFVLNVVPWVALLLIG